MTLSKPNASPATLTKNRVKVSPSSGLCVTCIDGCPGLCEIGALCPQGERKSLP